MKRLLCWLVGHIAIIKAYGYDGKYYELMLGKCYRCGKELL